MDMLASSPGRPGGSGAYDRARDGARAHRVVAIASLADLKTDGAVETSPSFQGSDYDSGYSPGVFGVYGAS